MPAMAWRCWCLDSRRHFRRSSDIGRTSFPIASISQRLEYAQIARLKYLATNRRMR
jgi:hypothetical protein